MCHSKSCPGQRWSEHCVFAFPCCKHLKSCVDVRLNRCLFPLHVSLMIICISDFPVLNPLYVPPVSGWGEMKSGKKKTSGNRSEIIHIHFSVLQKHCGACRSNRLLLRSR